VSETGRKYKVWEPLLLSIMTVVGLLAGVQFAKTGGNGNRSATEITNSHYNGQQVEEVIRFIETKYVGDVSTTDMVDDAIKAIIANLDPHTHYIPPDEVESLHERTSGNYVGIGIEVAYIDDSLVVLFPKKDSPAELAGLRPGDHILAVDGKSIDPDSMHREEILGRIKGEKGTTVQLTIKPLLSSETHLVEVVRDKINVPSVVAGYMMDSTTAYIKIARFTGTTYREFMDHWERMATNDGALDLILDLRDNPGGYLSEAVNILSQIFVEEGKLLLYTEGANQKRNEYKSTGKIFFTIHDVVVLINEGSASASEIIAGCLQDHDRGIVIGSPTYGKGLVQEQYELSNGGILRMTVSKYYTPSGRSVQKPYDDTKEVDTNAVFKTDNGRLVYPGGGITPDIVMTDSINWSHPLMRDWMDIISAYAIRYNLIHHDGELISPDALEQAKSEIPSDSLILNELVRMASKKPEVTGDSLTTYLEAHRDEILRISKATFIAYRTGEEGWYKGFNDTDPVVQKAMKLIGMTIEEAMASE
jgi:carboxyl-terminal processing protease